jgi:cell division protein FtsI (penicillin-binding protein 3)
MIAAQPFDDNPCRPRHFKPPPCAPVIPEGPARKALEACRTRLFVTSILFACVFAAVALRVVEVVVLEGSGAAQSHMPRFRIPAPPAPARADIVDRNGKLLAATLDSPSVYANPKQILDPADATRKLVKAFPSLQSAVVYA